MILDDTTRTLKLALAVAVTTNQLPVVVSFIEGESSVPQAIPFTQRVNSNDTTDVIVLSAPVPKTKRIVKFMSVYNADTVAATVLLKYDQSATVHQILRVTLQINETLVYTDSSGFHVITASGELKSTQASIAAADHGSDLIGLGDDDHTQYVLRSILTANEDIFKRSGGVIARLAKGSDNQVLTVVSGVVQWAGLPGQTDIGARAFHSTTQSIANNTVTSVSLDSERWDTDTIHDTVTNNSRLTAKTAGKYVIWGGVDWAPNINGTRQISIFLNGTTTIAAVNNGLPTASTPHRQALATIYNLAVNDFVELQVHQTSGVSLNIQNNAQWSNEFAMQKIA